MKVENMLEIIGADFYTGVPDSQLKALCDYLINTYGIDSKHHIIAANEGNCTAIAAGYHLATGKIPIVYMQNSGEGNIINPVASLTNDKVYAIPIIFIIGWRGEPGIHDEPQHIYQGEVTIKLLDDMDIRNFIIDKNTTDIELRTTMEDFSHELKKGKSVAFVVKKNAIEYGGSVKYKNNNIMTREEIIQTIVKFTEDNPIICTTGKASRELFEIRERCGKSHKYDFLTVGSMGHASSIALGFAINKPNRKIWCIDGDGAMLMHMGAMAVIGNASPDNMVHIVINNGAHETVGGMPTALNTANLIQIARACGYKYAASATNLEELIQELEKIVNREELCFLEIKASLGARKDLGRPTSKPIENKQEFQTFYGGDN